MAQEMLFGFCYMPQIIRVEDFTPYWVQDRYTRERTLEDLKIMRAIGTSCLRVHITPPVPGAIAYDRLNDRRTVPITGEKYLEMTDLIVHTAHELGIKIHFDIGSSLSEVSEQSLVGWIPRYRGLVESYQFANENYGVFASDQAEGRTDAYERYLRLLKRAHELDPDAKFTVDMCAEQLEYCRRQVPELLDSLAILNTHPYYNTDHRGWTEEWIRAIAAVHTPGAPWPQEIPWLPERIFLEKFYGIANFGKELWITETAATGDGCWSALVQDETEARAWRSAIPVLARCELLKRIYWCWFSDKMHSVEAGVTQAGAVCYDGAPTPLTYAFRDMAEEYAPAGSLLKRLRIRLSDAYIDGSAKETTIGMALSNRSDQAIHGRATLELPAGLTGKLDPFEFSLEPGAVLERLATLEVGALPETHNHVFLRVEALGQVHYGWGMVVRPRPLVVERGQTGIPGVRYLPDIEAVQDFLSRYGDRCAIVVGPGTGHWDVELGFRLKIVLEALTGESIPIKTWFMIQEVWDEPLIVVGRPTYNFIAQLMEFTFPPELRAAAFQPGEGFVQVVERPLGDSIGSWHSSMRERLLGFHQCPAALYIAGGDDAGSKAAAYDLIRRLWHPQDSAQGPKACWL